MRNLCLLYGLLWVGPLFAHDTWLLFNPTAPGQWELTSGMQFPTPDHAIKADRVALAQVRLAGQTTRWPTGTVGAHTLAWPQTSMPTAGVSAACVQLQPRTLELTEAQVKHYLDEIAAPEAVRTAWQAQPAPRQWRETYTKFAQALHRWGGTTADPEATTGPGTDLQIIPLTDPTVAPAKSDWSMRVEWQRKPLAGLPLSVVGADGKSGPFVVTGADGTAKLRLHTSGAHLVRGTYLRAPTAVGMPYESAFITLTFRVP